MCTDNCSRMCQTWNQGVTGVDPIKLVHIQKPLPPIHRISECQYHQTLLADPIAPEQLSSAELLPNRQAFHCSKMLLGSLN